MSPEFHRELLELDGADAQIVMRTALSRVGSNDNPTPKFGVVAALLTGLLQTGWPEQDGPAQRLREIRNDIDLRLARAERATA